MELIVDSREKWTQDGATDLHLKRWFDGNSVPYCVQKLDVGDYMLRGGRVAVDRKQSLDELAMNLMNRSDSARFWREVRRAYAQKIRLVVLCEHGGQIHTINDVPKWSSKFSTVTGRVLIDAMVRCEMAYGVTFLFCDKRSTARRIMEILNEGKADERRGG